MTLPATPSAAPRWLWITAELPGDMTTGRLVYSGHLITALADDDVDLTVVGYGIAGGDTAANVTWRPVDGSLRGGWRSLMSPLPNLAYACAGDDMRAAVAAQLEDEWDVIVVDHLQVAWALDMIGRVDAATVFVTHNHEATVRRAVARELPRWSPRRAVLTLDAWKAGRLERRALAAADGITAITASDRDLFTADDPDLDVLVMPPGWSGETSAVPTPLGERSRTVAVLGSFDWHVKQENLRRFVAAADPIFAEADIRLAVAGSVPDGFRTEIEHASSSVVFAGWVDDPAAFLDEARIGLIAEPLGGGFKLKSLDYVFHGVPIAALTGSAAGLPLERDRSVIEADDSDALARAIVDAIDDPDLLERTSRHALVECEKIFSWQRQVSLLVTFVATLRARGERKPRKS